MHQESQQTAKGAWQGGASPREQSQHFELASSTVQVSSPQNAPSAFFVHPRARRQADKHRLNSSGLDSFMVRTDNNQHSTK